jgi:hypothetical protein
MFGLFNRRNREEWSVVYTSDDPWEAEVVRAALLGEGIKAKVKDVKIDKKTRQTVVSVLAAKKKEADMVIDRTSMVISRKEEIIAEQEEREKTASKSDDRGYETETSTLIETKPSSEPVLLAEKDKVGKILYYEPEDAYELRLEMDFYKRSHFMPGEEWEEFIDFSAQRQEFFILLKEKYPQLAKLIKEHKMRADLLKLIEYSYGKSQPPRKS